MPHSTRLQLAKQSCLQWQSLATASYIVNMAVVKMSIGFFLLRISVHRVYIWILYISMAVIVVWSGGIFLFEIFQCNPVAAQWDFTLLMVNGGTGTCASGDAVVAAGYALSVLAVLSDWLYALLPIFMVWKVRMSLQAKITVILVLSLGVLYVYQSAESSSGTFYLRVLIFTSASIATLIRVRFLIEIGNFEDLLCKSSSALRKPNVASRKDCKRRLQANVFIDGATDALIWTLVEPGISIFAASIATLRPLLRALKLTGFSSADDERTTAQGTASGSAWQGVPEARPQELDEFSAAPPRRLNVPQKSSAIPTPRTDELSDDGSEDLIYTRGLRGKSQIPR